LELVSVDLETKSISHYVSIKFTEGLHMMRFGSIIALAMGLALASPARATLLQFDLTGSRQASFEINTDAIPNSFSSSFIGDQIQYLNVPGTYGGVAETATIGFGTFLIAQLNVQADGLGFTQFGGPDLFSGDPMHPTFNIGTFALTSIVSGASSIKISEVASAPESSTWAMMLIGFAGLGYAGYRASSKSAAVAA
jgi:hypothetical protein